MQSHDEARIAKDRLRPPAALRAMLFEIFAVRARGMTGVEVHRKGHLPTRS